jgi:hypothetical protein
MWPRADHGTATSEENSTMTTTYTTRHSGAAAFILYVLGHESHLKTEPKGTGFLFSFSDPEYKAKELEITFFSSESAVVGSARELLECARNISYTVGQCKQFGEWTKPE